MYTNLTLPELATRLKLVDIMLLSLSKRRMDLALLVAENKLTTNQKTIRIEVEDGRIEEARAWARHHKMSPHFAEALMYLLINESCKQQIIMRENLPPTAIAEATQGKLTDDQEYLVLKENLLKLTARWSGSYDKDYDAPFFATQSYLEFEEERLEMEIAKCADRELLLHLGCATGRLTLGLAEKFDRVVGYDICPHMIAKAKAKTAGRPLGSMDITFETADIEEAIPLASDSVSFVVMNLGTAGDIRNIAKVLAEIKRVLKPGGMFFLSFYNSEALLYKWKFIPWPTGLAAEVNSDKHCLDVQAGDTVLSVYARAYSIQEVKDLVRETGEVSSVLTYPTVSSILPNSMFEGKEQEVAQNIITSMDRNLSTASNGAYILVSGRKQA